MRRTLAALAPAGAVLVLVLVPAAAAHVTISPDRADTGSTPVVVFALPNESGSPVTSLTVTVPESFEVEQVEAKAGWRVVAGGGRVVWSGRLAPGRLATFAVSASVERPGRLVFEARERHADGSVALWQPTLDVGPAVAASRDSGARDLGKAALGVAIAAALLAAGAGFLALYAWLRGAGD